MLRSKYFFPEMKDYKNVLEQDLLREERDKRRERIPESKAEWVLRGENMQRVKDVVRKVKEEGFKIIGRDLNAHIS